MARRRHTAEEIIHKLREAEVALSQGKTVTQACKQLEVTEQTYYRWRKEYGGLRTDQAKRLRELERENARLKRLVADQALDNSISGRLPRETSEPAATARGRDARARKAGRLRASGVPSARPGTCDPAPRAAGEQR